jgi:flagellar hook-basal body complex protein FliE
MSQMQINDVLAQIRSLTTHAVQPARPAAPGALPTGAVGQVSGGGFGQMLKDGIDAVNRSQQTAASMAESFERGVAGVDLAQVMLETQKASVSFRALTEVRNRLVNVYQEIMNMPI